MKLLEIFDVDDDEETNLPSLNIIKTLVPQMVDAVQQEYDNWDEQNEEYAGGGICHLIADKIADIIIQHGIECQSVSSTFEQHVYVVAKVAEGVVQIDVPYNIYEKGDGYTWYKIPNVVFYDNDIVIQTLSRSPSEYANYVEEY